MTTKEKDAVLDVSQELSAEDIFASDDLTLNPFPVPEWKKNGKPGVIYFKPMSADEAINFRMASRDKVKQQEMFVTIFANCACTGAGLPLFPTPAHVEKLRQKNTAVFARAQRFLLEINGMVAPTKTWEMVRDILEDAQVEPAIVSRIESKWNAPVVDTPKNV